MEAQNSIYSNGYGINCFGRRVIVSDEEAITRDNVCDVLGKAMETHTKNANEITYLFGYERGNQPILSRVKEVRPEINNRVVENHASEIVNFYRGYVFGSPIAYIQRATNDKDGIVTEEKDNNSIARLNAMFYEESKASKDQQLAKDFFTCGVGYRFIFPKKGKSGDSPFDLKSLDPARTFIIYSSDVLGGELAGVFYYVDSDGISHFTVYTDDKVFYITNDLTFTVTDEQPNGIGMIPIIEYKSNFDRMGMFERCLPILDAINLCTSDRMNGLAQFIQSFIWMNNVDLTKDNAAKFKEALILLTKNVDGTNQAQVKYLTSPLNQQSEQVLKDDLYNQMLQISGVPSRESNTGGDTGQAVQLRNGFEIAESIAKSIEPVFEECERNMLKVALKIINTDDKTADMSDLKLSDIGIQFNRNRTDALLTKVQALVQLCAGGIHPLRAIEIVGLFSDAQQVYNDSKPYLKKYEYEETDDTI